MRQQTLFEIYDEEHPSKKICSTCKQVKDVSDFFKDAHTRDGLHSQCKSCQKIVRTNNKEHYQAIGKEYRENNKEHRKEYTKEYNEKNKEQLKEYRENNKEHMKEYSKNHYEKNKEHYKNIHDEYYQKTKDEHAHKLRGAENHLKRVFGITLKQYRQMFKDQDGCCAICGISHNKLKVKLHVDHDHTTGKIRGLLCSICNISLGGFRDSPEILQKAIEYLIKHKGQ
jgi:DNA anti-recombination protein RmuC